MPEHEINIIMTFDISRSFPYSVRVYEGPENYWNEKTRYSKLFYTKFFAERYARSLRKYIDQHGNLSGYILEVKKENY